MPSMVMSRKMTNDRLAPMLTMFWRMDTTIGIREFCIPMNHPVKQYCIMTAGAPQMHTDR